MNKGLFLERENGDRQQKGLNHPINRLDVMDMYKIWYRTIKEYSLFLSAHETYMQFAF